MPVPVPAPQPEPEPEPIVTLVLPPEKAVYLNLYRSHLAFLQHRVGRDRDAEQRENWDEALDPREGGDMSFETFCRGRSMDDFRNGGAAKLTPRQVLRPTWTAQRLFWAGMEVDHRIEMQVTPIGGEEIYDDLWNYELLDKATNGRSGGNLRSNITRERARLAAITGDQTWNTRDILRFHRVVAQPPAINAGRWTYEQVRDGEHITAFELLGGSPDEELMSHCIETGGR
jgi:hypothetical protein